MSKQVINLGSGPNTRTGTDVRTAGQMINDNFGEVYGIIESIQYLLSTLLVDDLTTGGTDKALTAEQGKTLKGLIDNINTLLTSDNVNLDNVQELVDAIETIQLSLSTILVNDLTTGGTTKALTAEQGKTLKGLVDSLSTNKVDKVTGYSLTKNDFTDVLKAKLDSITEIFTTALKTAYDGSVTWISTNGTTLLNHLSNTSNPHSVTKTQVGLGSVDNTADTAKPVSTAQATAIGLKQDVLTDVNFGTFENSLTAKATPIDADSISIIDSADSNKAKKTTFTQLKAFLKTYFDGIYFDLSSAQNVSGTKTFLNGTFGLRNVANTFTALFTNTNTAARTYTLQDKSGTLADIADVATKMNLPTGGIANYLPKFLTATTIGLSRIWDTGSLLGIDTVNTPLKDLTFGNQAVREIGVEDSNSVTAGRDLTITGGRAINFQLSSNFNLFISTASQRYWGMNKMNDGGVLVNNFGGSAGAGTFKIALNGTTLTAVATGGSGYSSASCQAPNGDIYQFGNDLIFKMTSGGTTFVSTGIVPSTAFGANAVSAMVAGTDGQIYFFGNGGVYVSSNNGTSYSQLQTTVITGAVTKSNGDILALSGGVIYKRTGGSGLFVSTGITALGEYITECPNGDVYTCKNGGDIYKQTGGTGSFSALGQTARAYHGIASDSNGNVFVCVDNGGYIYLQNNSSLGTSNLSGGSLKLKAGTGKGAGQSRYEIYTGQKTSSGTDMQVETLREYVDENGYHIYTSMPVYADNTAALAGGLPVGCEYRTSTGVKMIVF